MKRLRPGALPLVLACLASLGYAAETADKAAKIDKLMSQYADYGVFSGTVLVSVRDQVLFKKGYGLANRKWDIPNTPDVKFRLGSITKQFTSMLVMQQVAKSTMRLDGHLSDYLPYYRKDVGSKVTVHQLLNHTSGIPSYTDDPKFIPDISRNYYAVDDFVKRFCSGDLQFEPGTKFHYNNSGYFILGAILEHITGKPYEVLLKDNILDPLGMKDSGYDHTADILPKRATGYQRGLDEIVHAPYLEMALPYAAGSLYSTVEDLDKWDQALYTDKLLPAELKQKIFTAGLEHYGYGWTINTVPTNDPGAGQTMIAHGGEINGFGTLEQRLVGDHVLIVLLNNTPGANLYEMAKGIRAILSGQEPKPPKRSLIVTLGDTIVHRGVEAAVVQYLELKRADPDGYDFAEPHLNNLGHMLLDRNCTADAIAIFRLNAEEYPKSAEVYDSLAEAYEKDDRKQLAIENYRKAVNIDPNDRHDKDKLKALENN
jgi:CubicO group peptidase (beta-lactamase class C family)